MFALKRSKMTREGQMVSQTGFWRADISSEPVNGRFTPDVCPSLCWPGIDGALP